MELALNSAEQVSTGTSPAQLVFGENVRLPVDELVGAPAVPAAGDTATRIQQVIARARQLMVRA